MSPDALKQIVETMWVSETEGMNNTNGWDEAILGGSLGEA